MRLKEIIQKVLVYDDGNPNVNSTRKAQQSKLQSDIEQLIKEVYLQGIERALITGANDECNITLSNKEKDVYWNEIKKEFI